MVVIALLLWVKVMVVVFSGIRRFLPLQLRFSRLLGMSYHFIFRGFAVSLPWQHFPVLGLTFFVGVFSIQRAILPTLLILSPIIFTTSRRAVVIDTTPRIISRLSAPTTMDIISNRRVHLTAPHVGLSRSLANIPNLRMRGQRGCTRSLRLSVHKFNSHSACKVHNVHLCISNVPTAVPSKRKRASGVSLDDIRGIRILHNPFSTLCNGTSNKMVGIAARAKRRPPAVRTDDCCNDFND